MTDRSTEGHAPRWSPPALASNEFPDVTLHNLEAHIEELAAKIESCRKFILASRIAIAGGGIVLVATAYRAARNAISRNANIAFSAAASDAPGGSDALQNKRASDGGEGI
jgi:hypothetical protein